MPALKAWEIYKMFANTLYIVLQNWSFRTIWVEIGFQWGLQMNMNLSTAMSTIEKEEKYMEAPWDSPISGHTTVW